MKEGGTLTENLERGGAMTPELMAELQAAGERAMKRIRDPDEMLEACARMDRMGERLHREHGMLDIAVPSIRALRDGDDE
jgi:hypothetical protein